MSVAGLATLPHHITVASRFPSSYVISVTYKAQVIANPQETARIAELCS